MSCLSCCVYMTTNISNPNTNNDSPPTPPNSLLQTNTTPTLKPSITSPPAQNNNNMNKKKKKPYHQHKPRQPSVIEIERAIGAGRFRDADPRDLEEQKNAKFDMSTLSFPDKFEGSLQKQLRQVGEWMNDNTEKRFRLSGKKILKLTFMWLLPIWTLSLLVASGAIKLPFSNQFLDQLIM